MLSKRVESLAKQIWDFCNYRTPLVQSDAIIVLCSHDIRIAEHAADLFHQGWAPLLVFSGGLSSFTSKIYSTSEAESFAEIAIKCGVPSSSIVIENKSSNTQENLEFTFQLLGKQKRDLARVILVQKPNMLRRVHATATKLYPELSIATSSHEISFSEAHHQHLTREMLVHELVGDLQRIAVYVERGFITRHEIDPLVWQAFLELKELGYTGNLVE